MTTHRRVGYRPIGYRPIRYRVGVGRRTAALSELVPAADVVTAIAAGPPAARLRVSPCLHGLGG